MSHCIDFSKDSGKDTVIVAHARKRALCEPCAFRSPDGDECCCLMRDNFFDPRPDFRDEVGDLTLWVGTYGDIKKRRSGTCYKLLKSYAKWDASYPGISVLPDGTILVVTYVKYRPEDPNHSVVATRLPTSHDHAYLMPGDEPASGAVVTMRPWVER